MNDAMNESMLQPVLVPPREETVRQMLIKKGIFSPHELSIMSTDDLEIYLAENYLMLPICDNESIEPFKAPDEFGNIVEYTQKTVCNWTLIPKDKLEKINKMGIRVPGEEFYR